MKFKIIIKESYYRPGIVRIEYFNTLAMAQKYAETLNANYRIIPL